MITIADIKFVLIKLDVADKQVLFIILGEDGTINRQGDGSADCKDNDLYIGITKDNLFSKLKPFITEEMQPFIGNRYNEKEKEGRVCSLQVIFKGDNIETGTQFIYGELSSGPPEVVFELVVQACELTHGWHMKQKKMASKSNAKKPW